MCIYFTDEFLSGMPNLYFHLNQQEIYSKIVEYSPCQFIYIIVPQIFLRLFYPRDSLQVFLKIFICIFTCPFQI